MSSITKTDEEQVAEMVADGVPEGTAWSILSMEKGDTAGDIRFVDGHGNPLRAADCEEGRRILAAAKDPAGTQKRVLERFEEWKKSRQAAETTSAPTSAP